MLERFISAWLSRLGCRRSQERKRTVDTVLCLRIEEESMRVVCPMGLCPTGLIHCGACARSRRKGGRFMEPISGGRNNEKSPAAGVERGMNA